MDIISPLNNSLALLSRLREISKHINEAEIKNVLADLSLELADAKLAAADLKEQVVALREEVSVLKAQQKPTEKPEVERGCYYFDGDIERLYCAACYDSKGLKSLTARGPGNYRVCGVCKHAAK
ncbi:hypothetical protein GCM10009113_34310 [Marinobacter szutsaonensis]